MVLDNEEGGGLVPYTGERMINLRGQPYAFYVSLEKYIDLLGRWELQSVRFCGFCGILIYARE